MSRCKICGSLFHRTQPDPNWALEYWSALAFVVLLLEVVLIAAWVLRP